MFGKVRKFVQNEEGYTAESLTWTAILGVGAATVCFGIYGANYEQGGKVAHDMGSLQTVESLPHGGEVIQPGNPGMTGAATTIEVTGSN